MKTIQHTLHTLHTLHTYNLTASTSIIPSVERPIYQPLTFVISVSPLNIPFSSHILPPSLPYIPSKTSVDIISARLTTLDSTPHSTSSFTPSSTPHLIHTFPHHLLIVCPSSSNAKFEFHQYNIISMKYMRAFYTYEHRNVVMVPYQGLSNGVIQTPRISRIATVYGICAALIFRMGALNFVDF